MAGKKERKIQIRCTEEMANGVYSNFCLVNHNQEEFVLDFSFLHPTGDVGDIRSRVILHPNQVKRLVGILEKNLDQYEESYGIVGELPDDESDDFPPFSISFN